MSSRVKTAVVAIAGKAKRFQPASLAMPKHLFPVGNVPAIQLVFDEFKVAGITNFVFVIDDLGTLVIDYFAKTKLPKGITLSFVYQQKSLPYGNGVPLMLVERLIKNEPFVYAYGDDIVLPVENGLSEMLAVKDQYDVLLGTKLVSRDEIYRYGMVIKNPDGTVVAIREKPEELFDNKKEYEASLGRYVFSPRVFEYLRKTGTGKGGEFWTVDVINKMLQGSIVRTKPIEGKWLTITDPVTYLNALKNHGKN